MNRFHDKIWVGNSADAARAELGHHGIKAILNCAHDLQGTRGWDSGIYYAQCGLADGPGNSLASYYSAVLQLKAIIDAGMKVLVHCHKGESRSVAIVMMYFEMSSGNRRGWKSWLELLRERVGDIPEPHEAHRIAFDELDWSFLSGVK